MQRSAMDKVKRGNILGIQIVPLSSQEITHAHKVAVDRNAKGTTSRPLHSGFDAIRGDLIGAMAEIAVCLFYDEDYHEHVVAYDNRPGASPDLTHKGYKVSVKGTPHWKEGIHLILPDYDTRNDIYILVSVDVEDAVCGLRGWLHVREVVTFEPSPWRGPTGMPGAQSNKRWRYIPDWELRPCKRP